MLEGILAILAIFCLGKAIFMGWLHKDELRLLKIVDSKKWWKFQKKQACWFFAGIALAILGAQLFPNNEDKKHKENIRSEQQKDVQVENKTKKSNSAKSNYHHVNIEETDGNDADNSQKGKDIPSRTESTKQKDSQEGDPKDGEKNQQEVDFTLKKWIMYLILLNQKVASILKK
jgi:hypothetical protein